MEMANPAPTKLGDERVRLAVLLTALAVVAVVAVVRFLGGSGPGGGASSSGELEYVARNLPPLQTLDFGDQDNRPVESGGNPFAFRPPPTPTPNLTPPPTPIPRATLPPRPTPTPRIAIGADGELKPPPPPFNRAYIGNLGPTPGRVAAFRRTGDEPDTVEIEVAVVGSVLDDVYIVREIGLESVVIGFVGYAQSEDTRVPLSEQ
jgi:hypothetical protein